MKSAIPAIPLCTFALIAGLGLAPACARSSGPVVDEAKAANKTPDDFPTHAYDAFAGMDGGIDLSADEIKGRNTWLMWTANSSAIVMSRNRLVAYPKFASTSSCISAGVCWAGRTATENTE